MDHGYGDRCDLHGILISMKTSEWDRFRRLIGPMGSGCWEWIGTKARGYGKFSIRLSCDHWHSVSAHRLMWEHHNGAIPAGMVVMHSCDNRACVNLAHLVLGTQAENLADMRAKDRHAKGERSGHNVLTEEQVVEARLLLARGLAQQKIADRLGCARYTIQAIAYGRTWKHVGG